ncbi:MAG: O-antigen ligase family protein [Planctomycetota bacterium]
MTATREDIRKVLAWTSIALAMGLAFLSPFPTGSQYRQHWAVVVMFAVLLGAVALVARGLDGKARPRFDAVLAALGCLGAIFALQLVPLPAGLVGFMSPARLRLAQQAAEAVGEGPPSWLPLTACLKCTRDSILLLVSCASVFYAASTLFHHGRGRKLVMGAAVAGAAVLAVYGTVQFVADWGTRLSATYTNANRFAGLMAVAGACALGLFLTGGTSGEGPRPKDRLGLPRGTVWLAAAVVMQFALILTLSRLGIAAALAAGLLTAAIFTGRRSLWAVIAGVLLVLALNAALAADPVLARYSILFESGTLGRGRAQCWWMALPMVADFPLLGSGAGAFKHVFPLYQNPSLGGWYKFAHNDHLNLIADAGLLGFSAAVAGIVFLTKTVLALRSSRNPATRGIAVAACLALFAMLFHSAGDYPLQQPANAVVFFMICGIAYGRARAESLGEEKPGPPPRWVLPARVAAALVMCILSLPVLFRLRSSGALQAEAVKLPVAPTEDAEQWSLRRRLELFERAARCDEWDAESRYEAARTLVRLALESASDDEARDATLRARRLLAEGRSVSPLDPRAYYLLAMLDVRQGRAGSADQLMRFASKLAPAWPDVAFQVGRYFLLRWREARRGGQPGFALSRWQGVADSEMIGELAARMSESLSLAARSAGARAATVRLVLENGLSLREIDAALRPDGRINLALAAALARRGQHELACDRYELALVSDDLAMPTSGVHVSYARSLLVTGKVRDALEQFDEAIRAGRAGGGRGALGKTIRDLSRLRAQPKDAAAIADYWAAQRARLGEEPALLLAQGRAEVAAGRDDAGYERLLAYAKKTGKAGAFAELARVVLKRGELSPAAAFAAQATSIEPGQVSHHMLLAHILSRIGDLDGAASSFRTALSLKPRDVRIARALAGVETRAGRHDKAAAAWNDLLNAGGNEAAAHEGLADIYLRLRDYERAARELQKALEARPGDERLRKKLEDVLRRR